MKKLFSFFIIFCFLISVTIFATEKKYKGPLISELSGKKFQNNNFNSVIFGSISIYKKKKLIKSDEEIQIRIKHEKSKNPDSLDIMTNNYLIFQTVAGKYTIKDVFYKKKYYRIDKSFYVGTGDLVYFGNIKITLLKSTLENYSYKILLDTNFKALKFKYNRKLRDKINGNSPLDFLKKTEGKILVPIYVPSFSGEYNDKYTIFDSVENGDTESLKMFIKKGEDINQIDSNGWTLLMTALKFRQENIAEILLKKGADIDIKTKTGWNALMFAVEYGAVDIGKKLIKNGADVKAVLDDGWNVLFLALRYGCDRELLGMLFEGGCNVNSVKKDGWTPLMMALMYRDEDIAAILLDKGADINVKDNEGWTPLMYALNYGKHKLAKKMIEKGSDINVSNKNGWTPLLFALRNKAADCAKLLVEKGADTEKVNRNGFSPLHFALEYNFPSIAEIIIKKSKTLTEKTRYGWTPLMYALRYDQSRAASLLLKKGVPVSGMTKDGWNTLHLALRYEQFDNAIEILKRGKIDLNIATSAGWSPLLLSIRYNQPIAARVIIKKGSDINIPNKYGWTPLMMAIYYDQPDIAELLIKKKAKTDTKNSDGKSALDFAKEKNYFNLFKMMGGKNFTEISQPVKTEKNGKNSAVLKGIWKDIIPSDNNSIVLKGDNCLESSGMCNARIEYNRSKSDTMKFIVRELISKGFKYDKEIKAKSETGSLKNINIWGLVNFTNNTSTHVVSLTVIILSDYKSKTTKTVADFNRMRIVKKMKINIPKIEFKK